MNTTNQRRGRSRGPSFLALLLILSAPLYAQAVLYVSPSGSGTDFSNEKPGNVNDLPNHIFSGNAGETITVYFLDGRYEVTAGVAGRRACEEVDLRSPGALLQIPSPAALKASRP